MKDLKATIEALIGGSRGILAADESTGTIGKRFKEHGIESTGDSRARYRHLLASAPGLGRFVGGMILFDEALRQTGGLSVVEELDKQGIVPGIKVDKGTSHMGTGSRSTITLGLDGLQERLAEYRQIGARFTKWRGVFDISQGPPEPATVAANAQMLALFAKWSQEAGLVPIVEPEVLMKGRHDQAFCFEVTRRVLRTTFGALADHGVDLRHMLLKPNMVVPGEGSGVDLEPDRIAGKTLDCLHEAVPSAVPGVVFLSGGLGEVKATEYLNAINRAGQQPWVLSFSFGRALQATALEQWKGRSENDANAQNALVHRARCNHEACLGRYSAAMESLFSLLDQ